MILLGIHRGQKEPAWISRTSSSARLLRIRSVEPTRTKQHHARTLQTSPHVPDTDSTTITLQSVHNPLNTSRSLHARRLLDEHCGVGEQSRALPRARRSSQMCRFRAEGRVPNTTSCGRSSYSAGCDAASSRPEGMRPPSSASWYEVPRTEVLTRWS
jgi:hypothetical protein